MRISDADRSRAVEELRRHSIAGRLDLDTYAARVAEAMEAETLRDLDHALRDLPTMRIADPAPNPPVLSLARHRIGPHSSATGGEAPPVASARWSRLRARLVVLLSTLVLLGAVVFLILAHWVWAGVLVAGWIVGVVQGRTRRW